jgi:radical SAM protein with 4Fe4S-binding SPASM domain
MGDYEELRQKLAWRGPAAADGRFLSVFMDQNNRCNLKCRMCGFSDARVDALPQYDMPEWLFERIAAEVFPRANYLCLSIMTEPFMTRTFPDRLRLTRDVPFTDIITNGTLLTARSIESVIAAGITRLIFSIDGGTKEVFESIRPGALFERVLANFRLVASLRGDTPRLRINHVLSELNIDHFDELLRLAEELRPEEIAVRTVSRMSNAEIQEPRDPAFWSKVRAARESLATFCARTGIIDSAFLRDTPSLIDLGMTCRTPWTTLAIHPNGDVYPCMAWSRPPAGNLAVQSFDEIWNGEPLIALRDEFEAKQPGIDCLHCTIRRAPSDGNDDFFYEKLAKGLRASPAAHPVNSVETATVALVKP